MFTTYKVELIAGDYLFTVFNNEGDNPFILMNLEGWDDVITPIRKTAEKINGDGIFFSQFAKKPARNIEIQVKAIGFPINDLLAEIEPLMANNGIIEVKVYKYGTTSRIETASGFFSDNILWKTTGDDALASLSITLSSPEKQIEEESGLEPEWTPIVLSNNETDSLRIGFGDFFTYAEIYDEDNNLLEQPYDTGDGIIIYTAEAVEPGSIGLWFTTYAAPASKKFYVMLYKVEGEDIVASAGPNKYEAFVIAEES